MHMEDKLDKQIEGYLNGSLTKTARDSFEAVLARDPQLADKVNDLKAIEAGLNAAGMEAFLNDLQEWENNLSVTQAPVPGWKKYLAVAAIVTLVIIPAIYLFSSKQQTSEELFLAYYQPYEEMLTTRGNGADSLGMLLADGMDAYNRGAFQLCSELLESYLQQNPDADRVALYLGIAQLEMNQKQSAEANFIRAQNDPAFQHQAQWYQALSYLKFDETGKATALLRSISQNTGHYRKEQAARLLEQLN